MPSTRFGFAVALSFLLLHTQAHSQVGESNVLLHGRIFDWVTKETVSGCSVQIKGRIVDVRADNILSMRSVKETLDLNLTAASDKNGEYSVVVPTKVDARLNWFLVKCTHGSFNDFTHTMVYLDRTVDSVRFDIAIVQTHPTPYYQEQLDMLLELEKAELEAAKVQDPVLPQAQDEIEVVPERDKQGSGGRPKSGGTCTWSVPSQVFVQDLFDGWVVRRTEYEQRG